MQASPTSQRPATPVAGISRDLSRFREILDFQSCRKLKNACSPILRRFSLIATQKSKNNLQKGTKNMAENMQSKGVRMYPEQWKLCDEMCRDFGYKNPSEYIRNAVEFYAEWKKSKSPQKFLTPALESVLRGMIRDSENRVSRILFKNAVELHLLSRLIYHDYGYTSDEVATLRKEAVRLVGETNGSLQFDDNG